MKKSILTLIAAISVISAWAIEDAKMDITLMSTNSRYNVVSLEQGVLYTNEKNATDVYANITNTTTAVNIYAMADYGKMSVMTTNDLLGVYLGITTNSCTDDYTLTFTGVSGMQLYLVDHVTNEVKPIVENMVHTFDAAALSTIENRFQIARNVSVTLNSYGWASFSNSIDLALPTSSDLKAYKGEFNANLDQLTLNEVDDIPANAGVILNGTADQTYNLVPTTATADMSGNDLKPSSAFDPANYSNVFVLQGDALYEYTGSTALKANKAYLQLPTSAPAPARISMRFNGTTAIDNVEAESVKAEKFVENGQIFIRRGNEVYNLQGQMVK